MHGPQDVYQGRYKEFIEDNIPHDGRSTRGKVLINDGEHQRWVVPKELEGYLLSGGVRGYTPGSRKF